MWLVSARSEISSVKDKKGSLISVWSENFVRLSPVSLLIVDDRIIDRLIYPPIAIKRSDCPIVAAFAYKSTTSPVQTCGHLNPSQYGCFCCQPFSLWLKDCNHNHRRNPLRLRTMKWYFFRNESSIRHDPICEANVRCAPRNSVNS